MSTDPTPVPVSPAAFTQAGYVDSLKSMHSYLTDSATHWQQEHERILAQADAVVQKLAVVNQAVQAVTAALALEA